jgi:hypothetical protein
MMSDLDRLMHEIEQEAVAEGPGAVAELRSLDSRFHIAGQLLALRRRRGLTHEPRHRDLCSSYRARDVALLAVLDRVSR